MIQAQLHDIMAGFLGISLFAGQLYEYMLRNVQSAGKIVHPAHNVERN